MNSVSDGSPPLGDAPLVEHPTPNGVTEIAQRLIRFPFTPPDVQLKDEEALSSSKNWFTKHDKKEIDHLDSLDFFASSGPASQVTNSSRKADHDRPRGRWTEASRS